MMKIDIHHTGFLGLLIYCLFCCQIWIKYMGPPTPSLPRKAFLFVCCSNLVLGQRLTLLISGITFELSITAAFYQNATCTFYIKFGQK